MLVYIFLSIFKVSKDEQQQERSIMTTTCMNLLTSRLAGLGLKLTGPSLATSSVRNIRTQAPIAPVTVNKSTDNHRYEPYDRGQTVLTQITRLYLCLNTDTLIVFHTRLFPTKVEGISQKKPCWQKTWTL